MKLKIYGASDDLVEIEGGVTGECDVAGDPACLIKIGGPERCTLVRMAYAPELKVAGQRAWFEGCWVATIIPLDEDVPMFLTTVELGGRGYSAQVVVDVPDGTPVVWWHDGRGWVDPD